MAIVNRDSKKSKGSSAKKGFKKSTIVSMTGFSSRILELGSTQVTMSLKSLNSRFFEVNCKLPYAFTHLETEIIKLCKSKLYRGNIYFTLHIANSHALTASIQPALGVIAGYLHAIDKIKQQFSLEGILTINNLVTLPNVFDTYEHPLDEGSMVLLLQAIKKLIDVVHQARLLEGLTLAQDLYQRIAVIESYLEKLEPRAQEVLEYRKNQLFTTLKNLIAEGSCESITDTQNMLIYNQLDRIDINEEIVRFKGHLDNLTQWLESPSIEKGKKIDFILQELFREINTITSKCSDAFISTLAINIKVELEKAREQSQNIV